MSITSKQTVFWQHRWDESLQFDTACQNNKKVLLKSTKGNCSYVLYWAKEEGKTANNGLYESNQLDAADGERLSVFLRKILCEGRITCGTDTFVDDTQFVKTKE